MMNKDEFLKKYVEEHTDGFPYMLLDRMRTDCEYFIYGCLCRPNALHFLWASEGAEAHIAYMKYIWEWLEEKPEWLTMEQIEEYEKKMCK